MSRCGKAKTSRVEGGSYQGIAVSVRYRHDLRILESVLDLARRWEVCTPIEQYNQIPVTSLRIAMLQPHRDLTCSFW